MSITAMSEPPTKGRAMRCVVRVKVWLERERVCYCDVGTEKNRCIFWVGSEGKVMRVAGVSPTETQAPRWVQRAREAARVMDGEPDGAKREFWLPDPPVTQEASP